MSEKDEQTVYEMYSKRVNENEIANEIHKNILELNFSKEQLAIMLSWFIYIQFESKNPEQEERNEFFQMLKAFEELTINKEDLKKIEIGYISPETIEFFKDTVLRVLKKYKSQIAKLNASKKIQKSKKNEQMKEPYELFLDWKSKSFDSKMYKNNSDFADKIIKKYEPDDPKDKSNIHNVTYLAAKVSRWKKGLEIPE
jgi:hypothetical protein